LEQRRGLGSAAGVHDRAYGGPLDRAAGEVDVADRLLVELHDEQSAVSPADQQALLGAPLHRLAQGPAADTEGGRQRGLEELLAGLELAVRDRLTQPSGDDRRRRVLDDRAE